MTKSPSKGDFKDARKHLLSDVENLILSMKLDLLAGIVSRRLKNARSGDFTPSSKSALVELEHQLKSSFEAHGFGDVVDLSQINSKVRRINEYQSVLDEYDRKIRAVRTDEMLNDEDREEKIEYWKRLRDRDVTQFENGPV